jgi:dTDP-4-dehydrorhamnose 3,5-epimerase
VKFLPTELPGVIVVEPAVHRDARGFFLETFSVPKYAAGGITETFVQDNHSRSQQGTLRGLHAQVTRPQAKLLRTVKGEIFDVAVDIRRGSPHFGRWVGVVLSADNFRQLYIPAGFAHGFCVLSEVAEVEYKCSDVYVPSDEITIAWNDPAIGVQWPTATPLLSKRDEAGEPLAAMGDRLPVYRG